MAPGSRFPSGAAWGPILGAITAVAAVTDLDAFGPHAMQALNEVVPFDIASFNEIDTSAGRAVFSTWPPDADLGNADVEAFPQLVRQNPILRYQEATGDGSAHRLSDFVSVDELHGLDLYRSVYGPLNVEYQVAIGLAAKLPLTIAFALNRFDRDFTDDELALLDVLRPHLIQAYRNVQALDTLRVVDDALAEVGKAIIVLGQNGGDERAPPWAQKALIEHFGPPRTGSMPEAVQAWVVEQQRLTFDDGRPRIRQPLVSTSGDRQLVVRFIANARDRPNVLVVEDRQPRREATELQRAGLTAREAEILILLVRGETTARTASRLDVSQGTLNKHLQHIYRKLGVNSRAAAIAAATDAIFSGR